MSDNEFPTVCKDFQPTTGPLRKGCGAQIVMKKYPDGKWHPHNADGTPHKHPKEAEAPKSTSPPSSQTPPATSSAPTATKPNSRNFDRPYYDGVTDLAEVDLERAKNLLKEGWEILRIVEKQGWVLASETLDMGQTLTSPKKVVASTQIVYILGKRSA